MKKIVSTKDAPAAIGPYSQAVWAGNLLFCSGQLGLDPATGDMVGSDAASQAEQALKNVKALLASQGMGPEHVVKSLVLLADMADFAAVNEVYGKVFSQDAPARSCFAAAGLPKGGLVEIEVTACKG